MCVRRVWTASSRDTGEDSVNTYCLYVCPPHTYPLDMLLADRWNSTSVEVIPTHSPLTLKVAGSGARNNQSGPAPFPVGGSWNGGWGYTVKGWCTSRCEGTTMVRILELK